jgi:hypothetical protein
MSERFDREAAEFVVWYMHNRKRIPPGNIEKRLDFQDIAMETACKLITEAAINIKKLEGRDMLTRLWLPPGVVHRKVPLIELLDMGDEYRPRPDE